MSITHKLLHFGPIIGGTTCDPKLCTELLERGRKTTESHNKHLAGHIEKENIFSKDDKHWFVDNFQQYFTPYFRQLTDINSTHFYGISPFKEVWLSSLWINFMKKGEYNPPHNHDGAFSFVLYLQVPEELNHEDKNFKGRGTGPGCVTFMYGEDQPGLKTAHAVKPVTNELWIFPATLKHTVPPFKSDVERISVSGNWFILDDIKERTEEFNYGSILVK
jgi:uncharacterized protein (TIGR02466 family)